MALAAALGGGAVVLLGIALFLVLRPQGPPPSPAPSGAATPAPSPAAGASANPSAAPTLVLPSTLAGRPSPAPTPTAAASAATPAATSPPSAAPVVSAAEARLDRANDYMEKGRYAQALAEAKAVLVREPGNQAAKELAQDAEASILIEEAIKKARVALKGGDRDGALVEIRRGLAVNPSEGRLLALFKEATQ